MKHKPTEAFHLARNKKSFLGPKFVTTQALKLLL